MAKLKTGALNLISDVPGIAVGNAHDPALKSGATVVVPENPSVASVAIHGGAPGTRDVALLEPEQTVAQIDALVLSGGSAFGLDAVAGAQALLAKRGKGFAIGSVRVPIVPGAILFDLLNGGDKTWGLDETPYRHLGLQAAQNAGEMFALGTEGAGYGATTANLKGGLGSASTLLPTGGVVGALTAVNALGTTTFDSLPNFRAASFEIGEEFGGLGLPADLPPPPEGILSKLSNVESAAQPTANTTISVVATDLILTKAEAKRIAIAAHDGYAHALWPAHTPLDGDLIFVMSTGRRAMTDPVAEMQLLGAYAASTLARAIARAVYMATPDRSDAVPTWQSLYGGR
ncbi:P1 family peptidase [Pseudovibrio sp. SPO723]|uniref:P1 family peptidase n=1 Tax=Nesiotobacter zosterae TaxID=392721 RepID=UPI0029C5A68C|nr:P1 family peptidase [Pseudovibrio sp. SPO723]MDX5594659.1 P1 family peptidase [Pseudovibrio sp. SPO723]